MAILFDARGNEYNGQLDIITGNTLTDGRNPSANLGSLNAESAIDLNGHATLMVDVRGTFVGTVVFEGTIDGTNYYTIPGYNVSTAAYVAGATATAQIALNCAGYRRLRGRCAAYTSGVIIITMRATTADFTSIVERIPATLGVTVTSTGGTGATLTLPAPGVGMYQYIDWVKFEMFAVALVTAGSSPISVPSTNLPGNMVHSFRNDAMPQGTLTEKLIMGNMPIRASTANTAVTFTCPATTNILWRAMASYRISA